MGSLGFGMNGFFFVQRMNVFFLVMTKDEC